MVNVVIPLAGKDKRFEERNVFKSFVKIEKKPLIKFCTDSLKYPFNEKNLKLYFVILKEHDEKYSVHKKLKELYPFSKVIIIDKMTEGAACTVLEAKDYINNDEELIIYLADIFFQVDLKKRISEKSDADGLLTTFKNNKCKYSYALEKNKRVIQVAEKSVISDNASTGLYYFKQGKLFVESAEEMILTDENRAGNGAKKWFFICPVYNGLIKKGYNVEIIPTDFEFDLGDDSFIKKYLD